MPWNWDAVSSKSPAFPDTPLSGSHNNTDPLLTLK